MGSLNLKLYRFAMVSICRNPQLVFLFPKGLIPPLAMEMDRSGMILSTFTTCSTPKPLQWSHMPFGELKEKELGSGAG